MRCLLQLFKSARFFLIIRCLDSMFSALLPLSVLWFFKDQYEFARLEYINSFALIASNFCDFGFVFYGFFGYKQDENKAVFLERYLSGYCFFSIALMLITGIFSFNPFIFLVLARMLYLYAYRFFIIYFNLKEQMILINFASCCISLLTLILFFMNDYYYAVPLYVYLYVMPAFILMMFVNVFIVYKLRKRLFSFLALLKPALSFSWSIVLNTTLTALMGNVAKIILYNRAPVSVMANFSVIQRFTGVVYLLHGVIASYRSKHLFLMEDSELSGEFRRYLLKMMLLTFSLILVFFVINKILALNLNDYVIFALFVTTLLSCFNSFLELYFNRRGKPYFVLFITIFYSCVFYLGLRLISYTEVMLASLMLLSTLFSVVLTLVGIKYIKRGEGVEI